MEKRFSERQGLAYPDAEIKIRNDAPSELREAVIAIAYKVGLSPQPVRAVLCDELLKLPDPGNWSEYPNVNNEVHELIQQCVWFEVYNVIEALYRHLSEQGVRRARTLESEASKQFEQYINAYFRREGIGWQLVDGRVEVRGSEAFEAALREGRDELLGSVHIKPSRRR